MWSWNRKIIFIHPPKRVSDLSYFPLMAKIINNYGGGWVDTHMTFDTLNLPFEDLREYLLQGRCCDGRGVGCGGNCLGRFDLWKGDSNYVIHTKTGVNLAIDSTPTAGILSIALRRIPHFLDFCEMLSHGAYISTENNSLQFRIFDPKRRFVDFSLYQIRQDLYRRVRSRFDKKISLCEINIEQLIDWAKSLQILQYRPALHRLEFSIRTFDSMLEVKNIYDEFSSDRKLMEE